MNETTGKVLYGALFCILLPLLLILWAKNSVVALPVPIPQAGLPIALVGLLLMLLAIRDLWVHGKGLPMNAFPPTKFVSSGLYRFLAHPIYAGFVLICAGTSMASQSSTGFFLVTPTVILCCYSIVAGYEGHYLTSRFPASKNSQQFAGSSSRLLALLPVWLTWLAGYELLLWIGYDDTYLNSVLLWERDFAVMEWTVVPYVATYPFVIITPFLLENAAFKQYLNSAWRVTIAGLLLQFVFPVYASPRPLEPSGWMGELILWERSFDGPAAAFPSFHVLWVLLSAWFLTSRFGSARFGIWLLAALISISCFTTGNHALLDVVAAGFVFMVIIGWDGIAGYLQIQSEKLANSWKEMRIGPVRVINHALYAGLAGVTAGLILGQFTKGYLQLDIIILSALLGGAVWGQLVEGSPQMLRPFGYYGAILGGIIAMIMLSLAGESSVIYWLAVFAMATPLTQAVGRLRCLVQGCCHGKPSDVSGIRYFNKHTRVGQIPTLEGRMIHNTQGYSILFNLVTSVILWRLFYAGASLGVLAGGYFILTGAFRFVEEGYRGEPQTRYIMGLRLYQWIAVCSIITGCILTTIQDDRKMDFEFNYSWQMIIASLVAGLGWAFGLSVDFPKSQVRYSRLTG